MGTKMKVLAYSQNTILVSLKTNTVAQLEVILSKFLKGYLGDHFKELSIALIRRYDAPAGLSFDLNKNVGKVLTERLVIKSNVFPTPLIASRDDFFSLQFLDIPGTDNVKLQFFILDKKHRASMVTETIVEDKPLEPISIFTTTSFWNDQKAIELETPIVGLCHKCHLPFLYKELDKMAA